MTVHSIQGDLTPPQDVAAEQCALGAMMLSKDAIADVIEVAKPTDFYRPAHQSIYETILDLYGKDEPADPITVSAQMGTAGMLERIGGAPYLHTLIASVPTAANAGYYAVIVRDKAILRRLIAAGTKVVQLGYGAANGNNADTGDVVDRAQAAVYDVMERSVSEDFVTLESAMWDTHAEIEAIGSRGDEMYGVPTGFVDLDRLTNGFHNGQLIVIAGRPGTGKSTLATDILRHATVQRGLPAAIFSLEMGKTEITMRILSAESRVPLTRIRTGGLNDEDWNRLARRMGEVSAAPLLIDDSPNLSMTEIRAKSRRLKTRHDLRVVMVDYLQLMTPTRRIESREQEVAEISRSLKLLAKELQIPVIAVSQLNRSSEMRTDKRPQLSDLRSSGAIEQDADLVILLHREDMYEPESARAGEADLIVAKHRNGPTQTITVSSQLHYARFVDMARN